MDQTNIPFVAVTGGLSHLDEKALVTAKAAAASVGAELAKAGFGLVVYSSNEELLEPHVVSGYAAAALKDSADTVRVRYAESQRGQVKFREQNTRPELFKSLLFPGQHWEGPFYRSLADEEGVDALLLLGGGSTTFIAAQIAIARRLPILAVDEFGGSAAKIWNQLAQASPDKNRHAWGTSSAADLVAQLRSECAALAAKRKEIRRREQVLSTISAQRKQSAFAAGAFVALLATLYFGMVYTPMPSTYPFIMFLGLVTAGATGALVRAVMWGSGENDPRTSLLLGSVAGFVVGLAYLIPQWVGAPGVLAPKTDTVSATDKIQFASALLVALSAGIGFDTVFNRLQKQALDVAVGPPR